MQSVLRGRRARVGEVASPAHLAFAKASRMASRMPTYAPQRHKIAAHPFPELLIGQLDSRRRHVAVTALGNDSWNSLIMPTAEQIWPDVQYPHWKLMGDERSLQRMEPSFPARPSIVVISRPSYWTASERHDRTRSPSHRTVQAPHAPWLQPFFVPVRWRYSRSASRRLTRVSSARSCTVPLTRMVIDTGDPAGTGRGCIPANAARLAIGSFIGGLINP